MYCKKCNSDNIALLEGSKRRHVKEKLILLGLIILSFGLINIAKFFVAPCALFALAFIVLVIIDKHNKDRTATKCVCRNCGKKWYI